jgi:energy-coupling factor transport system ATP-binding protein
LTPILRTEKLTHIYSAGTPFEMTAIKDVDFQAERGEFIAIVGHTGSGKSTLIQHLNGLIQPTSGKIYFDGRDIYESKEMTRSIRFKVGLVFQYPEYQLFEETVYKDIAFGPKNMGLSEKEIDERVREAAGFVGLRERNLDRSPFELSGGQKRRAAIAGVIAMRPDVLILDEPTAGLDPKGCEDIIGNIKDFRREKNATIIMVTHNMEDAAATADRIVVMEHGGIAMDGSPEQVFSKSEELERIGLKIPVVTQIINRLRQLGLPVDGSVYTTEQAVNAILRAREEGRHA